LQLESPAVPWTEGFICPEKEDGMSEAIPGIPDMKAKRAFLKTGK
jgi:hypothetical protein